ncbi:MAG: hypothetical protein PHX21_01745 [bacterium]|nr:hypothetical protein [bacterium]
MNILIILVTFILSPAHQTKGVIKNDFLVNDDTAAGGWQSFPSVTVGNSGKFIITWQDYRNGSADIFSCSDIYAQIYNSDGTMQDTNFIINNDVGIEGQWEPSTAINDSGNFIIVWEDARNENSDIYAQRYNSNGIPRDINFKVNDDAGANNQQNSSVVMDWSGNFIIIWQDDRNGTPDIYAQRYNSNGIPQNTNFKVNDDTGTSNQQNPSIAMDYSGNFIISWQDNRNGNLDIYAQKYNSNGTPQDTNFKVNDDAGTNNQQNSSIAMDYSGNFIISWQDNRNGNADVYAQRYNSAGVPQGTNFKVNDDIGTSEHFGPAASTDSSGNFIITWLDGRSNSGIYAQRYNSNGIPQGTNFKVSDNVSKCDQWIPSASMNDSGVFVVAWHDWRNGNADIYAQRYASDGTPQDTNFRANDDIGTNEQSYPAVAMNDSNNFVITWRDERNGYLDIYAQRYNPDGILQGTNFKVNDDTGKISHEGPVIAINNSGRFVISWHDWREKDWNVYAKIYTPDGTPQGTNFKVNDDTGGDYNAYSSTAIDDSGGFVITWLSQRNGDYDIYAQRYDSNGIPQGVNFKVNDDIGVKNQWSPFIAMDSSGNFLIVWDDEREGNGDTYAQRYDLNGVPQGTNFKVNDDAGTEEQWYPSVAMSDSGSFEIAWQDNRNGNWDIYAQKYYSTGAPQGTNFKVNDDVGIMNQAYPSITTTPDGNKFVIVWTDFRNTDNDPEILAQKYENGTPVGNNSQINEQDLFPYNHQKTWSTSVACSPDQITFVWMDNRRQKGWDAYAKITDWDFVAVEEKNNKKEDLKLKAFPTVFYKEISIQGATEIEIYDIAGKLVKSLSILQSSNDPITNNPIPGLKWDGKNTIGKNTKSGVYFLKPKHGAPLKVIKLTP